MYPTELPAAPGGGPPLYLATRWARDTAAMRRGSVTTMYGCHLCNCRHHRCSQMPSGGQQGSSLPPPPLSIDRRPPCPSPPSPPGGIAGPVLTCRIPSTLQVSPPCSHAWCMLSPPCATMLVGDDGRPSAPTSGPCQRPPPPVRRRSSTTPLSLPPLSVAVTSFRHPPPSNGCRYARFAEYSGSTAVAGNTLP